MVDDFDKSTQSQAYQRFKQKQASQFLGKPVM